jgi:hypothetical protein
LQKVRNCCHPHMSPSEMITFFTVGPNCHVHVQQCVEPTLLSDISIYMDWCFVALLWIADALHCKVLQHKFSEILQYEYSKILLCKWILRKFQTDCTDCTESTMSCIFLEHKKGPFAASFVSGTDIRYLETLALSTACTASHALCCLVAQSPPPRKTLGYYFTLF